MGGGGPLKWTVIGAIGFVFGFFQSFLRRWRYGRVGRMGKIFLD